MIRTVSNELDMKCRCMRNALSIETIGAVERCVDTQPKHRYVYLVSDATSTDIHVIEQCVG